MPLGEASGWATALSAGVSDFGSFSQFQAPCFFRGDVVFPKGQIQWVERDWRFEIGDCLASFGKGIVNFSIGVKGSLTVIERGQVTWCNPNLK